MLLFPRRRCLSSPNVLPFKSVWVSRAHHQSREKKKRERERERECEKGTRTHYTTITSSSGGSLNRGDAAHLRGGRRTCECGTVPTPPHACAAGYRCRARDGHAGPRAHQSDDGGGYCCCCPHSPRSLPLVRCGGGGGCCCCGGTDLASRCVGGGGGAAPRHPCHGCVRARRDVARLADSRVAAVHAARRGCRDGSTPVGDVHGRSPPMAQMSRRRSARRRQMVAAHHRALQRWRR